MSQFLRKGKWAKEEEDYALRIIHFFSMGVLPIKPGTTLRSHLSQKLMCDPMRITKKFAGAACIGKQVFTPCPHRLSRDSIAQCADELGALEGVFLNLAASEMQPYSSALPQTNSRRGMSNSGYGTGYSLGSSSRKRRYWNQDDTSSQSGVSSQFQQQQKLQQRQLQQQQHYQHDFEQLQARQRHPTDSDFHMYEANVFAASDLLMQFTKKIRSDASIGSSTTTSFAPSDDGTSVASSTRSTPDDELSNDASLSDAASVKSDTSRDRETDEDDAKVDAVVQSKKLHVMTSSSKRHHSDSLSHDATTDDEDDWSNTSLLL